ncbi:GrpB family protein [Ureibacillus sp. Re31]|uniref:GrpB family protein n=1 Tax=Ureibacillus galli TaxID=2762222 RepID=A0ABR8XFU9_9BACL|nr:GrpB family protein [Ureibacillus galli]MBD8028054.1 GrpB family protein [Ureibacillus galli]
MRKVEVSSYREKWTFNFAEEAEKLKLIFGDVVVAIHHIGSTSVPGLKAKPIIDIMPVVQDIGIIDQYNQAMRNIGYEPKGEKGIPGRRYFQKGGDNRTHHVHIYEVGNIEIKRHLAFRDYLKSHPEAMKRYGELKERLAQQFPYDVDSYIKGKELLVNEIEEKALKWIEEIG